MEPPFASPSDPRVAQIAERAQTYKVERDKLRGAIEAWLRGGLTNLGLKVEYDYIRGRGALAKLEREDMTQSIGQTAFEAYRKDRDGKNHDGSKTPDWEDLGAGVQKGWGRAAVAVLLEAIPDPNETVWEFYEDVAGEHRWRAKDANNGNVLFAASEGYSNLADCRSCARRAGWTG
jgi:uncharacterized protein YegP (UPF0339 family)